ncbi:MAG: efflux RND transporter periplasmic adaptor subunit [Acidobacteriota bacterium]
MAVYRGDLTARFLLTGEIEAAKAERLVTPNVNVWPLQIRWLAEDGSEVRRGEKIVEFDNTQLVNRLEEARLRMIEAANQLESLRAKAASEQARAVFEEQQKRAAFAKARLQADVPVDVFAAVEFEKRQLDLRKAKLELAEAEAKLRSTSRAKRAEIEIQQIVLDNASNEVRLIEERTELLTLRASRDGIFILGVNFREGPRPLQVGDSVFPGNVVGRLPDLATMRVVARLFDVDDGRVLKDQRVVATLDAFPDRTFTGTISGIDQIADQASSRSLRRHFRTEIELDEIDIERMRPGMSVKVVSEMQHQSVLLVPRECVVLTADGPQVQLASGDRKPAALGPCSAEACIVESGLEESLRLSRVSAEGVG